MWCEKKEKFEKNHDLVIWAQTYQLKGNERACCCSSDVLDRKKENHRSCAKNFSKIEENGWNLNFPVPPPRHISQVGLICELFFSSFVFFGFDSPCLLQYMCLALYFYYLAMTPEIHTGSILGATQWVHCTTVTIIISTRSNCINENSIFGTTYNNCQDGTIYESHPYQNTQVTMKHITFS